MAEAKKPVVQESTKETKKKYEMLANINGYKKGSIQELTENEIASFGENYIKLVK